ncbi:MAG: hypothetical protein ACLSVD_17920 [Eggerthellaceae bacterium]
MVELASAGRLLDAGSGALCRILVRIQRRERLVGVEVPAFGQQRIGGGVMAMFPHSFELGGVLNPMMVRNRRGRPHIACIHERRRTSYSRCFAQRDLLLRIAVVADPS